MSYSTCLSDDKMYHRFHTALCTLTCHFYSLFHNQIDLVQHKNCLMPENGKNHNQTLVLYTTWLKFWLNLES